MKLSSTHVGLALKPCPAAVDWRRTTNYAAALDDGNPRYFDDTHPDGLVAHPVFPVAVTWPVTLHLDRFVPPNSFPVELMATMVHHSEHIAIHRPLRPPASLTVAGTLAAIAPHRAGTRVVIRYEAADETGAPVFTEHIGGLLRGATCTDAGRSLPGSPEEPSASAAPAPLWHRIVRIRPSLPYVYDGCSDIVFPIHTSPAFARSVGLPGILLQGTATLALAVSELVNREAGADPTRIESVSCRFSGMVLPGTDIDIVLTAKTEEHLFFEVINPQGKKAISNGQVRIVH